MRIIINIVYIFASDSYKKPILISLIRKYRKIIIVMKRNKILVPYGSRKKIAKDTGFSDICVRDALNGVTNTENSRLIRDRALKFYEGVEIK